MTYELEFLPSARKEWRKLGDTVREQFRKKLKERLQRQLIQGDALHGMPERFKIKLRTAGYRLVDRVEDQRITVVVIGVGKRAGGAA